MYLSILRFLYSSVTLPGALKHNHAPVASETSLMGNAYIKLFIANIQLFRTLLTPTLTTVKTSKSQRKAGALWEHSRVQNLNNTSIKII